MFKCLLTITLVLFGLLISSALGNVFAKENRVSKTVVLEPQVGEKKDFYVIFGDNAEVRGEVVGDVYVFAKNATISGKVNGDVIVVAGSIYLSGTVTQDARLVGGDVFISGGIGRNVSVMSVNLETSDPSVIIGGLAVLSGKTTLRAPITGLVKVYSKDVTVEGPITSDVEIWSESVTLGSTSMVTGDLTYYSNTEAVLQEGASVSGKLSRSPRSEQRVITRSFDKFNTVGKLFTFAGLLLVGLIVQKLFPAVLPAISVTMAKKLLKNLLLGFMFLIFLPLSVSVIMITVIGIPLGVFILFFYVTNLYLSRLYVAYFLGNKYLSRSGAFLRFFVALFLVFIVSSIPFLGGLFSFLVMVLGLGASTLTFWERFVSKKSKKVHQSA